MGGKNQGVLLLTIALIATFSGVSLAVNHVVGGTTGWAVPTTNPTSFYSTWASNQNFSVGDVLVFNFQGTHTVAEVSRANFNGCNTANTIGAVHTSSPTRVTLSTPGTRYFICTITGHCAGGQKLSVSVSGSSSTAPAASPTPSGGAASPAGGATSPTGSTTTPMAEGPSSPPPNLGTSTSVGLLSLVCFGVATLMF